MTTHARPRPVEPCVITFPYGWVAHGIRATDLSGDSLSSRELSVCVATFEKPDEGAFRPKLAFRINTESPPVSRLLPPYMCIPSGNPASSLLGLPPAAYSRKTRTRRSSTCLGHRRRMAASVLLASLFVACELATTVFGASHNEVTELRMPGIMPKQGDLYLCHSIRLDPNEEHNLVQFVPHGSMHSIHHMLLYGCSLPGSAAEAWDCGEMHTADEQTEYPQGPVCADGAHIIYAWARDAPELKLPKDVGFRVGGKTRIQYLVLQAHYMHPLEQPDYSGITLHSTKKPMPKSAGVALMVTGGKLPAQSTEKFETACIVDEDVELHPFAFRTHTHQQGEVVSGYVIHDGQWQLVGKRSPQDPQMFYPVANSDLVVRKNDILAARCTMSNKSDRDIMIGPTGSDEMCNFYMMYWVDGTKMLSDNTCFSPGPPNYYWAKEGGLTNVPEDASSL